MSTLIPGQPVRISDSVTRVLAPNPSVFTGPGTNTYLISRGHDVVVLDPGPADLAHIDALLATARTLGGTITDIICTHTHEDHSPGAAPLAARTGARLIGMPAPDDGFNDISFRPDLVPADNTILEIGGVCLRAVATPGHVSNHLCFLLEDEQLLFTGDHIMHGSTVVIVPPEGSMRAYLDSMARLQQLPLAAIAPGHGERMDDPAHVIAATTRHRLAREAKTLRALRELGSASLDDLLPRVYDDVPVFMHAIARLSLHAHLIKLADDGTIATTGTERWQS
jgi:glyoxylase-like metal-dependent hydrolase (beta-lactamase superfamily II)